MKSSLFEKARNHFSSRVTSDQIHAVVIGDVMLDKHLIGDVERILPEAPVPVLHFKDETHCAGGAANVAVNLVGLGLHCTLVGLVGNDADSGTLKTMLSSKGILSSLQPCPNQRTNVKTRVVTKNQQMIRIDRESLFVLSKKIIHQSDGTRR